MKNFLLIICIFCNWADLFCNNITFQNINSEKDSTHHIKEVTVFGEKREKAISGLLSGKTELRIEALKMLPKFLGETDPMRTLQLMPGVQTAGEANSGIFIRGCDPGHNQVLLDGATIYNPMHLMGFFSIFNSNHIQKLTLYKANINSSYGGRIGGLLDIESCDTIARRVSFAGGIGMINAHATIALPINRKSALYLSARKTYINYLLDIFKATSKEDNLNLNYGFEDYNLTYILKPSVCDKVKANLYYGGDNLSLNDVGLLFNGELKWKNLAASLQWSRLFLNGANLKQTFFYSDYRNRITMLQNDAVINLPSRVADLGYKAVYSVVTDKIKIDLGSEYIKHRLSPQYASTDNLYSSNEAKAELYNSHETALFSGITREFFDRFRIDLGLRYSSFFQVGPFREEQFGLSGDVIYSNSYDRGELIKWYGGFEPRFSFTYNRSTNSRIIMAYALQRQYISQVVISGYGFPSDFWVSSSKEIPPQHTHSVSIGYFESLLNDQYEVSGELYYKQLYNQSVYQGQMFDMLNRRYRLEDQLLYGKGRSYGTELHLRKNHGRFTGWISYTLGWSQRKVDGINQEKYFYAKHDRRHDFSVVTNYKFNYKWNCSAVFVYATGNAVTMPEKMYLINEKPVFVYGDYNGARMVPYHRLDLSVNYLVFKNDYKEGILNFSVYNAYARKNPVFLSTKVNNIHSDNGLRIRKSGKALYHIIPSISYSFKF